MLRRQNNDLQLRIADLQLTIQQLHAEEPMLRIQQLEADKDELNKQIKKLKKLKRRQPDGFRWITRNDYLKVENDIVPKAADGWAQAEHTRKFLEWRNSQPWTGDFSGKIYELKRIQAGKLRFIDYVVVKMAGGIDEEWENVQGIVDTWLAQSKVLQKYHPKVYENVSKSILLENAKDALSSVTKYGEGQTEDDRNVVDAVYHILLNSKIDLKEIKKAGISGYGIDSKESVKHLLDGKPRLWTGRPSKVNEYMVENLRKWLEENADECPCRSIKLDDKIQPVWELRQSVESILKARPDRIRGYGTTLLRKTMKTHLPWFKKAQSKYFCCGHCDQRCRDVSLLNESKLQIHLIANHLTPRSYAKESEHSQDLTDLNASMLPINLWLPDEDKMNTMLGALMEQKEINVNVVVRLKNAWSRLHHTQPHYIEKVTVRQVKNAQEARARNELHQQENSGFCVSVSDHITSVKLGLKKRMTMEESAAGAIQPLMIFIQTIDHEKHDANDTHRAAFVVISMRDDKTGWGISEVEDLISKDDEFDRIIKKCRYLSHWNDHGGSFPGEEVAGWILGHLPSKYPHLESIEYNSFAARHGKDRSDFVGSIIVRFLREKQATEKGLQSRNIDDIVDYLQDRSQQNEIHNGSDLRIHILAWKPETERPGTYPTLKLGNTRKSYSKVLYRRHDKKTIIIDKGMPNLENYNDQTRGALIPVNIGVAEREEKVKERKRETIHREIRDYSKPVLSEWAAFRDGLSTQECSTQLKPNAMHCECNMCVLLYIDEVDWRINPHDTIYKYFFANLHNSNNDNESSSSSTTDAQRPYKRRRIHDIQPPNDPNSFDFVNDMSVDKEEL